MIYFTYGSLLARERMAELSPGATPLTTAMIPHHGLCLTGHSKVWGGGTATITAATGREVWGGLYEIDPAGRAAVEIAGDAEGYVWCFTRVMKSDGERMRAGLLVKVRDLEVSSPSDEYLAVLRAGWAEWGLAPQELLGDCASSR